MNNLGNDEVDKIMIIIAKRICESNGLSFDLAKYRADCDDEIKKVLEKLIRK